MAGDAAPTRLGISVGGRLDRMTIEIFAQEFGARTYIRTRFRYSTNGSFWAGFTYDAYCEVTDSASVMALSLSETLRGNFKRGHLGNQCTVGNHICIMARNAFGNSRIPLRHQNLPTEVLQYANRTVATRSNRPNAVIHWDRYPSQ